MRAWLRALGSDQLPASVHLSCVRFRLLKEFKHDFFAATGLYERTDGIDAAPTGRAVVKIGRTASLLGLPLMWLGRASMRRERTLYRLLDGLPGVPLWLGEIGSTGFAHGFVEGHPLRKGEAVADDFFPRLADLLREIHRRGAAYVDLEKRENIIVGDDGRPYLIDFQISWYLSPRQGGHRWPWRVIRDLFCAADQYHLLKHRRRHRPDQLTPAERARADRTPAWVQAHRAVFRPLTVLRRRLLEWLGARPKGGGRSEEQRDSHAEVGPGVV